MASPVLMPAAKKAFGNIKMNGRNLPGVSVSGLILMTRISPIPMAILKRFGGSSKISTTKDFCMRILK